MGWLLKASIWLGMLMTATLASEWKPVTVEGKKYEQRVGVFNPEDEAIVTDGKAGMLFREYRNYAILYITYSNALYAPACTGSKYGRFICSLLGHTLCLPLFCGCAAIGRTPAAWCTHMILAKELRADGELYYTDFVMIKQAVRKSYGKEELKGFGNKPISVSSISSSIENYDGRLKSVPVPENGAGNRWLYSEFSLAFARERGCVAVLRPAGSTTYYDVQNVPIIDIVKLGGMCDSNPGAPCQCEVKMIYDVLGMEREWVEFGCGTMLGCHCLRFPCQSLETCAKKCCDCITVNPNVEKLKRVIHDMEELQRSVEPRLGNEETHSDTGTPETVELTQSENLLLHTIKSQLETTATSQTGDLGQQEDVERKEDSDPDLDDANVLATNGF